METQVVTALELREMYRDLDTINKYDLDACKGISALKASQYVDSIHSIAESIHDMTAECTVCGDGYKAVLNGYCTNPACQFSQPATDAITGGTL